MKVTTACIPGYELLLLPAHGLEGQIHCQVHEGLKLKEANIHVTRRGSFTEKYNSNEQVIYEKLREKLVR